MANLSTKLDALAVANLSTKLDALAVTKFSMWLILSWLISVSFSAEPCSRPWVIPLADRCTRDGRLGAFFFFNVTVCMNAPGREKYCIGRDGGFCAQRDSGSEMGMYQVECG